MQRHTFKNKEICKTDDFIKARGVKIIVGCTPTTNFLSALDIERSVHSSPVTSTVPGYSKRLTCLNTFTLCSDNVTSFSNILNFHRENK